MITTLCNLRATKKTMSSRALNPVDGKYFLKHGYVHIPAHYPHIHESTHPPTYPSSIHLNIYVYIGLPCSSDSKESACNAGDPRSIPGLGRSSGGEERNSHILFPSLSTLNSFLFLQSFSTKFSHIVLPRVM